MSDLVRSLIEDLRAETDQLRQTVEELGTDGWTRSTPAEG